MLATSAGPPARRNEAITARLREAAQLLERQKTNPFRVRAFRRAADTIARLPEDVGELNPSGKRWLPVLHTERGAWHFTALFSNTARAHELGRTRDWVVVYFRADHEIEGQRTIVTEIQGPLAGQRVVRGRESEYDDLESRVASGVD